MSRATAPPRKVIAVVLSILVVLSISAALALGVGSIGRNSQGVSLAKTVEEENDTTAALAEADRVLAQRQQDAHSGRLDSELKGPLRQSRADVNLSRELLAILHNSSESERTAAFDAAAVALTHRTHQARNGALGGSQADRRTSLVTQLKGKQTDLQLSRELLAILRNSSTSERTAILAAAETALVSHRQQASETDLLPARAAPFFDRQQGKVQAADTLVATNENNRDAADLARAVSLARTAQRTQAGPLAGRESAPRSVDGPNHDAPSVAAFGLLERHGVTPTAEEAAAIKALDDLPEPTRSNLTAYLNAYIAYEQATEDAFADVNRTRLTRSWVPVHNTRADLRQSNVTNDATTRLVTTKIIQNETALESMQAAGVNVTRVVTSRDRLLVESHALHSALASTGPAAPGAEPVRVDGVLAIDLRETASTYTDTYALLVDGGGDDTYRNNAGGNNLANHACDTNVTTQQPTAAALVDLGGNDTYTAPRGCGHRGGAQLGSGFLLDAAGDDIYTDQNATTTGTYTWGGTVNRTTGVDIGVGRLGTNGGGAQGGIGFLLDASGDDAYRAGWEGTNGGGYAQSTGFLLDAGGNDTYTGGDIGTNGGGAQNAVGFHMDTGGNDTYTAVSGGTNGGGALQGEGFLLDVGGNDHYSAGGYGTTGGSYAGSEGFLADTGGTDTYRRQSFTENSACRCYGPGFGIMGGSYGGGVGFLLDATGNDSYFSGFDGANGGGRGADNEQLNVSAGFLFDGSGSDIYKSKAAGTNGGASKQGRGFLVDAGDGDDIYATVGAGSNGGGSLSLGGGGMDMAGAETTNRAGNGRERTIGRGGFLLDAGGSDTYNTTKANQGGGVNGGGAGFLLDAGGSDTYAAATERGVNGGATRGFVGFLLDVERSNDTYIAKGKGANGGGANAGVGFLLDAGGHDTYRANANDSATSVGYGTNGGGFHGGAGFLLDAAGDDSYTAGGNGTNGGGYVVGVGFLVDAGGDDRYIAGQNGTNGGAAAGASGLLIDTAGDDTYTAGGTGTNGGAERAVAVLLDVHGQDTYQANDGTEETQRAGNLVNVARTVWRTLTETLGESVRRVG